MNIYTSKHSVNVIYNTTNWSIKILQKYFNPMAYTTVY